MRNAKKKDVFIAIKLKKTTNMNVKGIIVEQIEWDGTSKSLTMKPDFRYGDLWVAFPTDYDEPRTGPFYFQNPNYERKFSDNKAECKKRRVSTDNFYQKDDIYTFKTIWHNIPTERESLTYYALYLPEYAIPINVDLYDQRNTDLKFKRTIIKDNQNPRYIIYLKCASKFGTFNFNLECQFKKDRKKFASSNFSDKYQTDLYSNPDEWQNFMKPDDKVKTQKFFAEQIIVNNGNFEQTYKPTQTKKKFKLELSHWIAIISCSCAVIVLIFGNNLYGRFNTDNKTKPTSQSTKVIEQKNETLIAKWELKYLENTPIVDKGLFVKYYFNDFIFGGVNLEGLKLNARDRTGESLIWNMKDNEVHVDINKEPYIEFEYKGTLYSIEILGQHPNFICKMRKNIKSTLILKRISEL